MQARREGFLTHQRPATTSFPSPLIQWSAWPCVILMVVILVVVMLIQCFSSCLPAGKSSLTPLQVCHPNKPFSAWRVSKDGLSSWQMSSEERAECFCRSFGKTARARASSYDMQSGLNMSLSSCDVIQSGLNVCMWDLLEVRRHQDAVGEKN